MLTSFLLELVDSTDLTPDKGTAILGVLTEFGYIVGILLALVGVIAKGVSVGIAMSREDAG